MSHLKKFFLGSISSDIKTLFDDFCQLFGKENCIDANYYVFDTSNEYDKDEIISELITEELLLADKLMMMNANIINENYNQIIMSVVDELL